MITLADSTSWTEKVYALDSPTNWVEISKIFSAIQQAGGVLATAYDDSVIVTVVDTTGEGNYQIQFRYKTTDKQ